MKKLKSIKSKIIMFIFALVLPLSATFAYTLPQNVARADEASTNYYNGYMKEVTMSNNNFNSSSSTYSISTNLSGWTGQVSNSKTTAGIINTGNSFQTYMANTYRLSKNPLAKATDQKILMINSRTADSKENATARQGYKSNTISLDANSYYSFQVSFKNDTNYNSYDAYVDAGIVDADTTISKDTFAKKVDDKVVKFGNYISFSYKGKEYYLLKELTPASPLSVDMNDVSFFYEDEEYYGFTLEDGKAVYVNKENVQVNTEADQTKYSISSGTELFTCNLEYNSVNSNYKVSAGTKYYKTQKEYTSLNDYVYGSIYLDGLKDSDGNAVKAEYVKVSSKEWITFYFFVATGNESQSVNMQLWLGGMGEGRESSGVVFYDDCHVYQYSENQFWKIYSSYIGKTYTQEVTIGSETTTQVYSCSSLLDLRETKTLQMPEEYNFGFEAGSYNADGSPIKNWTKTGSGNAQVFNNLSAQGFKSATGYDFVGSTLSATAEIDGETVNITPNNYVLGFWADNQYVKATSKNININANEILKVTAHYKVSELSSGKVYMFVEENNSVINGKYGLTDSQYTLTKETASTGVSTNGSSAFNNNYGTIEFYVKGGVLYNSSFNISLGLGKADELATGAVVFDDITIEKASSADYEGATNKVAFSTYSGSTTITNGNFNNITINNDSTAPFSPDGWTITKGSGTTFAGVINTEDSVYQSYRAEYERLRDEGVEAYNNPYLWAGSYSNPKNCYGSTVDPDNILMISNMTSSWQKVQSSNISLTASGTQKISFKYNTASSIKVCVYGKDGFKLYESAPLTSNGSWSDFEIYLKSIAGTNEVYVTIELGNEDNLVQGFAYFDNFELKTVSSTTFDSKAETKNDSLYGVVDMTNFYLNLPTNNITNDINLDATPAYKGILSSGDKGTNYGGVVKSDKFENSEIFNIEGESTNVFFINNQVAGGYIIQSNYGLDLSADNYYVLTFKIKTNFATLANELDEDEKSYGATVGLTGYDYLTEIKTTGDEYQTYSIYFKPTETKTANLYIALVSGSNKTAGSMVLYDLAFEETDEDTYNSAVDTTKKEDYDQNSDNVFVANAEDSTETDSDPDTETDSDADTNSNDFSWLLLTSTLITGLAIVIAIVGWALRKVKIKKIERKRKETYDRKSSLNIDHIKQKAKKQRDAEVADVQNTIGKFQKELDSLEAEHKQKVLMLRDKDKGQMSKETDKEFKLFAKKRTVIAEKIDSLNKHVEELKSPEYLLSLERRVYVEEEMKRRELEKVSKKANKQQELQAETKNTDVKKK
ncbi:MAG: hypothetical protein ACI4R8_01690 [Candidatus Caccovivens sp.]